MAVLNRRYRNTATAIGTAMKREAVDMINLSQGIILLRTLHLGHSTRH